MRLENEPKTPSVGISPMTAEDVPDVVAIGGATPQFQTGTDAAQFYSPETLERWCSDLNGVALVAKDREKLVGFFLGYAMQGPRDGYLNCVAVLPEYRQRRIGLTLMEEALKRFEALGINHVFGSVQEENGPVVRMLESMRFGIGGTFRYVEKMLPAE